MFVLVLSVIRRSFDMALPNSNERVYDVWLQRVFYCRWAVLSSNAIADMLHAVTGIDLRSRLT